MLFEIGGLARPNASFANVLALNSSWFRKNQVEPWNWFVPDLVTTVTAAPAAMPWSASKLLVATLTVSIVSADCTKPTWWGSQTFTDTAPSMRKALLLGCVPLTNVRRARPGVSISAFWNWAGVAPGTRFRRPW
ncbi:MAG: hypothetical protein DMF81_15670 [Acidobacteria bacterium]|nr:MAG: hypothetical protein DMF81_15670 [Acidobacteriota bacterium]